MIVKSASILIRLVDVLSSSIPGKMRLLAAMVFAKESAREDSASTFSAGCMSSSLPIRSIKVIPWNGMSINGARTAVALVVIGLYLWAIRHKPRMNRWVLLGALAVCGTNILFSIANKMTTAANAIVLQFTAPIFVMVFTAIFFRRRPGKLDLVTCAAVLGGILFFFVDSLSAGGMVGNVLALISGISYAGVFMMNDMPEGDAISSVFWGDVFSAVVGLPFVAMETDFSATAVVSVLILGVFQVALAYILLTIGLKTTPPVTASLVSGIEPVLNPILVAVFYHEMIGPTALVGAVIVVGSVVAYNVICGRREHKERVPAQGEKQQSC